uniref:Uncharacterized protein n=1 Tax=Noctiluca scintillans TaxID=2966 RepID=A0A7S1EX95_NOCSC|mmetsp:Transcript_1466/g.3978  ORF Transcript_1466/g.3978 Transcript_1466/m.3978 type:complete len:435 (+) Transcript_1466:192-1496(+)
MPSSDGDPPEVCNLLAFVEEIFGGIAEGADGAEIALASADGVRLGRALEQLCIELQPEKLKADARRVFVERALETGLVKTAVRVVEVASSDVARAAIAFLADFTFFSDVGAQAVLQVFDRVIARFNHIFNVLAREHLPLLESAILLCVNVSASCPSSHMRLIPLVQPVCLQIVKNAEVSDRLRGNTILLLANLSMTVSAELRVLDVAAALLELINENRVSEEGKSVAESVIIFLHGQRKCKEIDCLMEQRVVSRYCVPIMEHALRGTQFRNVYPYLLYSAKLFQVLAKSPEYAALLGAEDQVVTLLLSANHCSDGPRRLSSDLEGRCLALEALSSLAHFRLWPPQPQPTQSDASATVALSSAFVARDLPLLLMDEHIGIRAAAVALWARLNPSEVQFTLLVGRHLEVEGKLPPTVWRTKVLVFLFPFLTRHFAP